MKLKFFLLFLLSVSLVSGQQEASKEQKLIINRFVEGTLLLPKQVEKVDLVILIADSGPTDRDGNQNFLKNDALKKLAKAIVQNNIATFRYDKRTVKQIRQGSIDPNMMFDDFVTDAISTIDYFRNIDDFNKIFVIGHGQGSLVGMLAAKEKADGFISLAGAGKCIDSVILEQVEKTAPMFTEDTKKAFAELREGRTTNDYPAALSSIFKKDNQAFIMNWMQYNPQEIISQLKIPVLIINGTKDLQVSSEEASLLRSASKNGMLAIIENMNHVLVDIQGGSLENSKSYNESYRKLSVNLINEIVTFIQSTN